MRRRARIDSVQFEGVAPFGATGVYLIGPDGVTGWDDGADIRREETVRPVGHGSFPAAGFLAARVYGLEGTILASTPAELRAMIDRFKGILSGDREGRLVVEDDGDTRWAPVRRAGKPHVRVYGARATEAEFAVTFWAADPWQFGDGVSFPGPTAQVVHRGNENASPIIEVTGTLPGGYQVASQGKQFNVSQALTSGQTHRIDMRTGWLYRNGSLQTGAVATSETFTIPPNRVTPVVFTPASGSGVMTVKVVDTYI